MAERSQPGNYVPHFSVHRLRQRAKDGRGEINADQLNVERLLATQPEGTRPDPRLIDASDVARGFGLPDAQVTRITNVIRDVRADFSTKGANQRIHFARGTLLDVMRTATPRIPSDIRQEVLRRAISYWKSENPIDLGRVPTARYGMPTVKSEASDTLIKGSTPPAGYTAIPGGKRGGFRKRSGKGWSYWYPDGKEDNKDLKGKAKAVESFINSVKETLERFKKEDAGQKKYEYLEANIRKGMGVVASLFKRLTGRAIPGKGKGGGTKVDGPKKPRQPGTEGGKKKKLSRLAKMLLAMHKTLAGLLDETVELKDKARTEEQRDPATMDRISRMNRELGVLTGDVMMVRSSGGKRLIVRGTSPVSTENYLEADSWSELETKLKDKVAKIQEGLAGVEEAAFNYWKNDDVGKRDAFAAQQEKVGTAARETGAGPEAMRDAGNKGRLRGMAAKKVGHGVDFVANGLAALGGWIDSAANPDKWEDEDKLSPAAHGNRAKADMLSFVSTTRGRFPEHLVALREGLLALGAEADRQANLKKNSKQKEHLRSVAEAYKEAAERLAMDVPDPEAPAPSGTSGPSGPAGTPSRKDLEAIGGKHWGKKGHDRVYFNASETGLGRGEKFWFDLRTKEWKSKGISEAKFDEVAAKLNAMLGAAPAPAPAAVGPTAPATPAGPTAPAKAATAEQIAQWSGKGTTHFHEGKKNIFSTDLVKDLEDAGKLDEAQKVQAFIDGYNDAKAAAEAAAKKPAEKPKLVVPPPPPPTKTPAAPKQTVPSKPKWFGEVWSGNIAHLDRLAQTSPEDPNTAKVIQHTLDSLTKRIAEASEAEKLWIKTQVVDVLRGMLSRVKQAVEAAQNPKVSPPPEPPADPRKDAEARIRKVIEDPDTGFVNDRKSAVEQRGEDVVGSARERAMEWKGVKHALLDVDAGKMFKRKFFERQMPLDLISHAQNGRHDAMLYLHLSMQKFPATPPKLKLSRNADHVGTWYVNQAVKADKDAVHGAIHTFSSVRRTATEKWRAMTEEEKSKVQIEYEKDQRQGYYDAYQKVHAKAKEMAEAGGDFLETGNSFLQAVHTLYSNAERGSFEEATLNKMRRGMASRGSRTTPQHTLWNIVDRIKKEEGTDDGRRRFGASNGGLEAYRDHPRYKEVCMSMLEGNNEAQAFGDAAKKVNRFDPTSNYNTDVMHREGPKSEFKSVEQGLDLMDKESGGKFGMRGLQWGKSVTDEERKHHLKSVVDSCADLTDMLGLPPQMASFNGKLALAIGARGRGGALAHYEPKLNVINLTRANGAGSLAHEWGHFFDYTIAEVTGGSKKGGGAFEKTRRRSYTQDSTPETTTQKAMKELLTSDGYAQFSKRVVAVTRSQKNAKYWQSDREQFARCFERHLQRKMEKAGRANTYLVSVKKSAAGPNGPWPTDEEVDAMAPHFDKIFSEFAKSDLVKKALRLMGVPVDTLKKSYEQQPGKVFQSMPDFSIYYAPEDQGRREQEIAAAENRVRSTRKKNRGFFGTPPTRQIQLKYNPDDTDTYPDPGEQPKLGIKKPTHLPPKGKKDKEEDGPSRGSKASRKLKKLRKKP